MGIFEGMVDFGGGVLTRPGPNAAVVARYGEVDGGHIWSHALGEVGGSGALRVVMDPTGNAVVLGFFSGSLDVGGTVLTAAGNVDGFILRLRP